MAEVMMESGLNGAEEAEESNATGDEATGVDENVLLMEEDNEEGVETGEDGVTGDDLVEDEVLEDDTQEGDMIKEEQLEEDTDAQTQQQLELDDNEEDEDSKLLELDGEETTENGDGANLMATDLDEVDLDEMDEQNSNQSLGESESALIIATEGGSSGGAVEIKKEVLVENGVEEDHSSASSSCGGGGGVGDGSSKETKSSAQKSRSFSVSDGNAIAKELEEQVGKLNDMLLLKEKEWGAILRLKKHMEFALDQVKRTQRMANLHDGEAANGPMSSTEITAALDLITSKPDIKLMLNTAELNILENIDQAEIESESMQSIFPMGSSQGASGLQMKDKLAQKCTILPASAALQKLNERKRKAMEDLQPGRGSRPRINDSQSGSEVVITPAPTGKGRRRGNIVDVQSLIETHGRSRQYKGITVQMPILKKKQAVYAPPPNKNLLPVLEEMLAMVVNPNIQKEPAPVSTVVAPVVASVPQIASTRSLVTTIRPKNGKPTGGRQGTNSILISNATPSGSGTLAKMLSPSTHSGGISATGASNSSQKLYNKNANSESGLSLANLLATSKVESKVSLSKVKKERIREEDQSHVPSQQQSESVPICQGCSRNRAQFVCAGCANQWYCSRQCQIDAWDEHSEICSG